MKSGDRLSATFLLGIAIVLLLAGAGFFWLGNAVDSDAIGIEGVVLGALGVVVVVATAWIFVIQTAIRNARE